ncbi:hypothetical protein G7Z17_g2905 [Cylindrodendrum hubeiense]|uniref:Uncharacterized protein n=1 Tax=Cylindrodendrum hubeiense TaxID=595255 RepID=A0A9P5HHX0_9HYPO|nr:hypothetical protein G7Z17_g2905 [Cylindrodendrum hubeiense]
MAGRDQPPADRAAAMLRFDMAVTEHGTPLSKPLGEAAVKRRNIPTGIQDQILRLDHPEARTRLWIVDRTLEPQTVAHFFEFVSSGQLPGGSQSSLPRPTHEEFMMMMQPFPQWAPAPYNEIRRSTAESIMVRIGSREALDHLTPIAKELHCMKTRIWEGIPPVSERRWKDLELDRPDNFSIACQFIVAVINVFYYLNHPMIKHNLRVTSNLISDHLKEYEEAINALRKSASSDGSYQHMSATRLWHEFISAHYKSISTRAHKWAIEHIDRLRAPVIVHLATHQPAIPGPHDARQWELTNKFHDLNENTAHANFAIFIPTDGYRGDPRPAQDAKPLTEQDGRRFREEPISWSANLYHRQADYNARVRYLSRVQTYNEIAEAGISTIDSPVNDPRSMMRTVRSQTNAHIMARRELRGEPEPLGLDTWLDQVKTRVGSENLQWGYVAFRLNHEHNDGQWAYFKQRFEDDCANWGDEFTGIDDVRNISKIHWLDGKELGIEDGDIEAAKVLFKTYVESTDAPTQVRQEMFLVADGDVISSYLNPTTAKRGFVLAVDADFDPTDTDQGRNEESPGYSGAVRVLGSLLWDDLGAQFQMQTQQLVDLWPLAMNNPALIYEGPLPMPILRSRSSASLSRSMAREMAQRYAEPQSIAWIVVAGVLGNHFFGGPA